MPHRESSASLQLIRVSCQAEKSMTKIMTTRVSAEEAELSPSSWATRSVLKNEPRVLRYGGVDGA